MPKSELTISVMETTLSPVATMYMPTPYEATNVCGSRLMIHRVVFVIVHRLELL